MGVTMAVFALIHGLFSLIQFHGLGNVQPLISLFTSNTHYGSVMRFPFQPLGFFALIIILLMASTSHDFWLKNLGPRFWKTLHMLVYLAYGLLLMHVMLGVVQLEQSAAWILLPGLGMILIVSLHAVAGLRTFSATVVFPFSSSFMEVCSLDDIPEKRAKMVLIGAENIAIFRYDGKLSAVSNVCKHQNGPLGEGRIVDSCIVCPWHGYEYRPEDGCSPPPFTERIATYELRLEGRKIWVDPRPRPEGSRVDPILIPSE
jgi:nitrite reductase/ring-hydroxylating ferredoxin subunit